MGRNPFPWTPEIEEEIFDRMIGGEPITEICGKDRDDWLPSEKTFYVRLSRDPEFQQEYTRAREVQAHQEADQILAIADSATNETYNTSRIRIDARKWRASKMAPKKYGDKLDHTSSDGSMTPASTIDVSKLSNEALEEIASLADDADPG